MKKRRRYLPSRTEVLLGNEDIDEEHKETPIIQFILFESVQLQINTILQ